MSLVAGARLGPYEVTAPLGVGGMGEVYRARDTKLNRAVALKVLPREFVTDPERLARFQREAEVLASLNHPNIAQIYGVEDSGETTALVLELVEGPTLADQIERGKVPLDEALDIAKQIADALEAAHALGIIHRDLKPANVKITPEGIVKVLDFGLAKAFTSGEGVDSALSVSPTLTKGTALGTILGTAAYMSPEQAKGKPVDTRTDVWAFGAVVYEMLAGKRAFEGEDVSDTLVSVFRDDPDWSALPKDVPARVFQAMRVCLQKDAKERVRDIAAVRLAMAGAFETEAPSAGAAAKETGQWKRALPAIVAAAVAAIVTLVLSSGTRAPSPEVQVSRTSIVLPQSQARTNTGRRGLAVSPTGEHIVYVANEQLYLRAVDDLDAEPLDGTEGSAPTIPFFSPDGQWIGFYSTRDRQLKKIALTGGAAVTLCDTGNPYGASWSSDGTIVFGQGGGGLFRVPAAGGPPELLIEVDGDNGERAHGPQLLPDGRTVVFTLAREDWSEAQIVVELLDTGERHVVIEGGTDARYLPTGHLVYALAGNLLVVPFDVERLEVEAGPVPLVERVSHAFVTGGVNFDVSRNGMLVYLPGGPDEARTLVWVDRDGQETPIRAEPRAYDMARIAPDGTLAVLDVRDRERDLWVWDFARETLTRLTFSPARDVDPVWTPDGRSVVFGSDRDGGARNLYRKAVDGTGEAERLTESTNQHDPRAITPDGTRVVFREISSSFESYDLAVLHLDGEPRVEPLLDTEFNLYNAHLSPDGRWLAYESNDSGEVEIYVRPFPGVEGGRWPISSGGGWHPLWGPSGDELFFRTPAGHLMRVPIDSEGGFRAGNPEVLFEAGIYALNPFDRSFDISPDGERFLMMKDAGTQGDDPFAGLTRIIVVQNWFQELNARVPVE